MFTVSCKKEDSKIVLEPDAGMDQVVVPLKLVTLDGSATCGPDGYSTEWIDEGRVPEEEINFAIR